MTSILVVLMLTVCTPDDCYEEGRYTWQADSTNALVLALDECDDKAKEMEQDGETRNDPQYARCVIENEG